MTFPSGGRVIRVVFWVPTYSDLAESTDRYSVGDIDFPT